MASLIKSRQRVIDHVEVFTLPEIVEAMLNPRAPESQILGSYREYPPMTFQELADGA